MAKYFSSSVLSGKRRKPPRDRIDDQRYRYLGLENAEPDLGDPLVGPSSEGKNPVKSGDQYIIVAVEGFPGERFWIPNQGGLIPGSISVFDESNLVGSLSSITQLDFLGAGVKASTDTVKISTLNLSGNFSFSENQVITQVGNSGVSGVVRFSTTNSGIVTLTNVDGSFNTSGALLQNSTATGVTPSSISVFNDPSIRAQIEITPEFFSENRQFIFNDNDEFNGALNLTYNQLNDYVGVGTTAATQMLHVQGNLRLTGTVYDSNNFEGAAGNLLVKKSGSEELIWVDQGSIEPDAGGIRGSVQYHNAAGKIGGAPNFVFNDISGANNVGIGSTLPKVDLDVVGVATFSSRVQLGNLEVIGPSVFGNDLDVNANIDVSGTSTFNDPVSITDATESTSFSTGSLKVTGGVGIGSSVFIGQSLNLLDEKKINIGNAKDLQIYHDGADSYIDNLTNNIYIRNNVDNDDGGNIYLRAKFDEDGIVINDDGPVQLYHNGSLKLQTNSGGIQVFDTITATTFNATDSEVTDLTVTGTADIATADVETLNVNTGAAIANINEINAIHTDTDTLNVGIAATISKLKIDNIEIDGNNITAKTGNLVISADGTSFVTIDKLEITDNTDFAGANAALIVKGGADIDKKLNVDGVVTFTKDTESTSPTTGGLQITGGVGIAKQLNVAGITSITNTTISTDISTGAFKVAGGVGILGSLNIGGSVGFGSTAVPSVNNQHDFGTASKKWKNIYADKFIGNLEGTAEKTDITADSTNTNRFIFLSDVSSGSATAFGDTDLIYNPSVNALGIATDRFDSPVSSTNTGKIAVGIVTAHELYGALKGNADTATKLLNARDFSIDGGTAAGDVFSSTVSFDGTANVVLDGSLRNSGVTAGTYGNKNAAGKGTAYARIEVNAQGVVTSAEQIDIDGGEITVDTAKNVAITEQTDSTTKHYIHFGDVINTNLSDKTTYDRVNVDSDELVYVPNTGVGIGSTAPTTKLDVGGESRTTTLTVTETSTFSGNVDINASVDIQNELIVGGATTLANNGGITTTGGDLYIGGDLFVKDDIFYDELSGRDMVISGIATINQLEVGQPSDTLVGITSILDEGDMVSNSATALATQQSIKTYVDNTIDAANDLEFHNGDISAGIGTVDLDSEKFAIIGTTNEIETSVAGINTLQIGLPSDVTIGNNLTVTNNLTVSGNTTLGDTDATTDTVTFNSKIDSDFLPNGSRDIGASDNKWANVYATTVTADVEGNTDTASRLQAPVTITLGDQTDTTDDIVSIGKTFDGSRNVGFALSLTDTGVTAGEYGDNVSTLQIEVDARGRLSSVTSLPINDSGLTAGKADKILVQERDNDETCYLTFINVDPNNSGDYEYLFGDDQLTYNPSSNALGVAGKLTVGGLLDANGNVDLGSDENNTLSVNALVDTHFIPSVTADTNDTTDAKDLGTSAKYWRKLYVRELIGDTVSATATSADTIKTVSIDTDASYYITFVDSNNSTADFESLHTDAGITYNPSTDKLDITGATTVGGNLNVNGNTTLGDTDATSDTVTFNSKVDSDILPSHNATSKDDTSGKILGSENDYWRKIYVKELIGTTVTANAITADEALKLTNARNFSISGDGSAPDVSFDGTQTGGVDLELTLDTVNTSTNVPQSGENVDTGGQFGSSTFIPQITVNKKGLVTAIANVGADFLNQVTNESNKIKVTERDVNASHYLTFISRDPATNGAYEDLFGDNGLIYNPSTNKITAGNLTLNGSLSPSLQVAGEARFNGDVVFGTGNTKVVKFFSKIESDIIPSGTSRDIGSSASPFDKIYANEFVGEVAGIADEAAKLNPGAKINLSGDVTATMANPFTGESDITLTTDISNTTVTPGAYPNSSVGLVPTFEVSADGRLTAAGSYTPTLPSSNLQLSGTDKAVLFNNSNSVGYADGFSIDSKTLKLGTADLNTARIRYYGANANRAILRIDGPGTDAFTGNFGFDISYMGARSGNANSLSIFADNGNSKIEAINILQNGNTGFGVVQTTSSATEHDIPASGGGVVTVGKLKAREIEVTGDVVVADDVELDNLSFLNLGDTPTSYSGKASKYVKVNNGETGLVFSTINATDVQNLTSTIQSTNLTSSQITDLTTTIQNTNLTSSQVTDLTTTINNTVTDTNHTYDLGVQSGGKIRLTTGGSGSGTDDVTLIGGTNVTVTSTQTGTSEGTITISASGGIQNGDNATFESIELLRGGGPFIDFKNSASDDYDVRLGNFTQNHLTVFGASNNPQFIVAGSSAKLISQGTIESSGNITAFTSDIRLKKDIEPIKNALEKVQSLRGFTYSHNETAKELGFTEERRWSGVSAQEIEKVLPEAVFPAPVDDKYLTVQYEKLVPLLIEAIKELKEEVNDLRSQIGG